jgi:mannosyltransferase OCH1-like enzyme
MKIPKIVHLTVKNKERIPELFKENLDIMHHYYREHEFRIYDDADIDDFVSAYDLVYYEKVFSRLFLQIMRVDAVRYLWMEAVGGIYFDFDIRLQRQWEPSGGAVLVGREWTWPKADDIKVSVHNCVFASTSGHPLWRRLLDGIGKQVTRDGSTHRKWPSVFDVTGPNAISRTITQEHLAEKLDDVHILKPSCIYQRGLSTSSPEDAFFIHQATGSWNRPPEPRSASSS